MGKMRKVKVEVKAKANSMKYAVCSMQLKSTEK
jgi:hypothetical protein